MTAHRALTVPTAVKLTVGDFEILGHAGAFDETGRTELIDGRIYVVNAEFRPHAYAKTDLGYALVTGLAGTGLRAVIDGSVSIAPVNMPMPDIVVTDAPRDEGGIPVESCRLLVEISASSIRLDSGKKARIYAGAGVPEYWIVDLKGREVRILTGPGPRGYASETRIAFGQRLASVTIEGLAIETHALA